MRQNIVLFDDPIIRGDLLPFTYTRPVALLRCGIDTLAGKWQFLLPGHYSFLTEPYLQRKFPLQTASDTLYINGAVIPDPELAAALKGLAMGEAIFSKREMLIGFRGDDHWKPGKEVLFSDRRVYEGPLQCLLKKWDIMTQNGAEIAKDFDRITKGRASEPLNDPFTYCYCPERIFVEPGAVVKAAILNAEGGPVYIGKDAVIQEGAIVQGPFALGEGAVLAQGAKIRPNTTVGPFCKVGGEVSNCVFFAYSNKGHDGYLGNSVVGEWCNMGANTNNSNLKNDFTHVKLFSYTTGELEDTGLLFCGLFMGDYSKTGISTMFNTGTVVGVHVNVFGAGFQAKFVPSFSWGGQLEGCTIYRLEKALAVSDATLQRKGITFGEADREILAEVFKRSEIYRAG